MVGLLGGIFRKLLSYLEELQLLAYQWIGQKGILGWLIGVALLTLLFGLVLWGIRKFAPEAGGSGIHEIEGALANYRPMRWKRVIPIKFFGALISLGSGLALGREGPTIQMGANVGKAFSERGEHDENITNNLISAGSAAGLAAAFNAPFSAVIFILEEMRTGFHYSFFSFQAVIVASAASDIVVRMMTGQEPIIPMTSFEVPDLYSLWFFLLLGLLFGVMGLGFNHAIYKSLDFFKVLSQKSIWLSAGLSACVLLSVMMLMPEIGGGGYQTLFQVLQLAYPLKMIFVLFLARFCMTVFSYGTGMPGGVFVPMLTLGTVFSVGYGMLVNQYWPALDIHPSVFAVAGMAAMFAATVRAPLTGIALAIEITGNFALVLPLMVTSMGAAILTAELGNKPIYSVLLQRVFQHKSPKEKDSKEA